MAACWGVLVFLTFSLLLSTLGINFSNIASNFLILSCYPLVGKLEVNLLRKPEAFTNTGFPESLPFSLRSHSNHLFPVNCKIFMYSG